LIRARTAGRSDEWQEIQQWPSEEVEAYFRDFPEDLSSYTNWSQSQPSSDFPVTHAPGHRLNWKPGTWGKGTMDQNGNYHTWNLYDNYQDGEPIHDSYEKNMGIQDDWDSAYDRRFHIHPDGYAGLYGTYDRRSIPFPNVDGLHALDPNIHGDPNAEHEPIEEDEDDWS